MQRQTSPSADRILRLRCGVVDLERRKITRDGETTRLTEMEASLLAYLAERSGEAVSLDQLLVDVWGYRPGVVSRAPTFTLRRLRQKIEVDATAPDHLQTAHGKGIRFVPLAKEESTDRLLAASPYPLTNLSTRKTLFVGRESELAALGIAAQRGAVIALLGAGGIGKTRLAQEFGLRAMDRFEGGAWFVELAAAREEDDILHAVADVLDVPLQKGAQTEDNRRRIGEVLRDQGRCLLILDNGEQIDEVLRTVVHAWSTLATDAVLLVTSRVRLQVEGAQVVDVGGLGSADARALLADRLAALQVSIEAAPAEQLDTLSRLLDGMPLALELASARARLLGLSQIIEGLKMPFSVLYDGSHVARHQTMSAAVRWSWDLLTRVEQRGLAQLSVFRGGFDLESALAVLELASAEDGKPVDAVAVLESLVNNSTVEAVRDGGAPGFKLLLPIREFANQQISGRERSGVWARYTALFLDRARAARARHGDRGPENFRVLDTDLAELLHIVAEARDPSCRAEAIWFLRPGLLRWGQRQRLARMLDTIDLDALEGDIQPAMAICLARSLVVRVRFAEAVALLERFRESAGAHLVWLHTSLAWTHLRGGDLDEAERSGTEALSLLNAPVGPDAAAILGKLSVIARRRNELDLAHVRIEEALGALRDRDHIETARCHLRLGYLEHALGRYARSHTSFSRSIEIADRLDERDIVHLASCARASLTYETDDLDAALHTCASLVENGRRMGLPVVGANLCLALATRAVGEDRIETARILVGECRGLFPADVPPRIEAFLTVTEAMAMHWEGRLTEAVAGYRAGLDALGAVDEYNRQQMLPYGIVALVQAGDLAQGRAWLEDIEAPHESAAQCLAIVRAFVEGETLPEPSEVAFGERVLRRLIAGA